MPYALRRLCSLSPHLRLPDAFPSFGEWAEGQDLLKASPYVLSSRARDLMERHRIAFTRNQISIPYPDDYAGEAYIEVFKKTLSTLASWMEENA